MGFCFQKGKVILAPLLEVFKGDRIPLGMNKAASDLRRSSLKTVGEVPGEAGNSSGAAAAPSVPSQVPLELLYLHGQNRGVLKSH